MTQRVKEDTDISGRSFGDDPVAGGELLYGLQQRSTLKKSAQSDRT
jgi:hypothetical protein